MLGSPGEVIEVVNMGTSSPTSVMASTARTRSACACSGSNVSSRFHREIAAIETQVAEHLAQVVVLHLRQLLRVQAHRRLGARFRAAGLVLRRARYATRRGGQKLPSGESHPMRPAAIPVSGLPLCDRPDHRQNTFFPWYAVMIM